MLNFFMASKDQQIMLKTKNKQWERKVVYIYIYKREIINRKNKKTRKYYVNKLQKQT